MKKVHGIDHDAKGPDGPLVGALLRRPFLAVRTHVLAALREDGFDDLQPAHLAVFQFPGPNGRSPSELAFHAAASKQAMNNLLSQLERSGYLVRSVNPANRRERLVQLTDRGDAVVASIRASIRALEASWAAALGTADYARLTRLLGTLNDHLVEESS